MRGMTGMAAIAALIAVPVLAQATPTTAAGYSSRLQKLDPLRRSAVLRRAILDSGEDCARVEKSMFQGPWKNLVMWSARCSKPDTSYGLFLGPDGSVQVRPCADLVKLRLPACRRLG